MKTLRGLWLIVSLVVAVGLYGSLRLGAAQDSPGKGANTSPKSAASAERHTPLLGVMVDDLDSAIASHLPGVVPGEQGVLVREVSDGSPAAKGGIKTHDILTTYDDQKLFSPEQLFKLVRGDKPGREVTLGLIREGKPTTVKVTLAERAVAAADQRPEPSAQNNAPRLSVPWLRGRGQRGLPDSAGTRPGWKDFDSMTLKKLDKDRFHASIKHTDPQGKLQTHEFEGTRDEIHKKIEADEDLTPAERAHLLRSLDLGGPVIPFWIFPEEPVLDF